MLVKTSIIIIIIISTSLFLPFGASLPPMPLMEPWEFWMRSLQSLAPHMETKMEPISTTHGPLFICTCWEMKNQQKLFSAPVPLGSSLSETWTRSKWGKQAKWRKWALVDLRLGVQAESLMAVDLTRGRSLLSNFYPRYGKKALAGMILLFYYYY